MADTAPGHGPATPVLTGLGVTGDAAVSVGSLEIGLRPTTAGWELLVWSPGVQRGHLAGLMGTISEHSGGTLVAGPDSRANATWLRRQAAWLRPSPVGPSPSLGMGDRIGMATPGHVRAMRGVTGLTPVYAQQSARELERTGRTWDQVLATATFGVLASGWRSAWGADADHLKTVEQLDAAIAAGFTNVTIDPFDHALGVTAGSPRSEVEAAIGRVPWDALQDSPADFAARYGRPVTCGETTIALDEAQMTIAAARFGAAVAHVATMARRLPPAIEVEVAIDELPFPSTAADHVYLTTELHRLGVTFASFAPGFVGVFEKGVDYIGSPVEFARDVELNACLAGTMGPYKLSLHSGSEKFAILGEFARAARPRFHLKTSGTSYLDALAVIGAVRPDLLRRIWAIALEDFERARSSYKVVRSADDLPRPEDLSDPQLLGLLEGRASRQVLHVTYGAIIGPRSVLGDEVRACVWANREAYWSQVATNLTRHAGHLMSAID